MRIMQNLYACDARLHFYLCILVFFDSVITFHNVVVSTVPDSSKLRTFPILAFVLNERRDWSYNTTPR